MPKKIRMAVALPTELEEQLFEMEDQALQLAENDQLAEALDIISCAWNKLPEPKFNTSCSHIILNDLVMIQTKAGKHDDSETILHQWINDLENSGYEITETAPFILLGETYLYRGEVDKCKAYLYKAVQYGASQRDFSTYPSLYFDIAKKKISDADKIRQRFAHEVAAINTPSSKELTDEIIKQIEAASEKGNKLFDADKYTEAITVWKKALNLIPSPQNTYAETFWLEASLGDACFFLHDFTSALHHFENAKGNITENGYLNPFVMLRVGQMYYENHRPEEAKEYLLRAYVMEGKELFDNDDAKYFSFLKDNVELA